MSIVVRRSLKRYHQQISSLSNTRCAICKKPTDNVHTVYRFTDNGSSSNRLLMDCTAVCAGHIDIHTAVTILNAIGMDNVDLAFKTLCESAPQKSIEEYIDIIRTETKEELLFKPTDNGYVIARAAYDNHYFTNSVHVIEWIAYLVLRGNSLRGSLTSVVDDVALWGFEYGK